MTIPVRKLSFAIALMGLSLISACNQSITATKTLETKEPHRQATAANKYLGGIGASLNNPNMMFDLTIPNNNGYQQKILDSAVADFLVGDISLNQAVTTIDREWDNLTTKMGRSQQKTVYRIGLGLNP